MTETNKVQLELVHLFSNLYTLLGQQMKWLGSTMDQVLYQQAWLDNINAYCIMCYKHEVTKANINKNASGDVTLTSHTLTRGYLYNVTFFFIYTMVPQKNWPNTNFRKEHFKESLAPDAYQS
jgi:hypothetical protein